MKILKRLLMSAGGIAMCAVALQLGAPRTVHGVVATMVNVVGNAAVTNSTDATGNMQALLIADTEQKAFHAFRLTTNYCPFTAGECSVESLDVSGNQVLVINDVSAYCTAEPSDVPNEMVVTLTNGLSAGASAVQYWITPLYIVPGAAANPGGGGGTGKNPTGSALFGKQTYIVMDSAYNHLFSSITPTLNGNCSITYSGYYVRNN
jgi:hypothetical protein